MKSCNSGAVSLALLGALLSVGAIQGADAQACGPRAMHRHGGHHHGMQHAHASAAMPAGVNPATLPDAQAVGARLLGGYCTQCHGLPHPELHAGSEWPAVAGRMYQRMLQSGGRVYAPGEAEFGAILAYLQEHARDTR